MFLRSKNNNKHGHPKAYTQALFFFSLPWFLSPLLTKRKILRLKRKEKYSEGKQSWYPMLFVSYAQTLSLAAHTAGAALIEDFNGKEEGFEGKTEVCSARDKSCA